MSGLVGITSSITRQRPSGRAAHLVIGLQESPCPQSSRQAIVFATGSDFSERIDILRGAYRWRSRVCEQQAGSATAERTPSRQRAVRAVLPRSNSAIFGSDNRCMLVQSFLQLLDGDLPFTGTAAAYRIDQREQPDRASGHGPRRSVLFYKGAKRHAPSPALRVGPTGCGSSSALKKSRKTGAAYPVGIPRVISPRSGTNTYLRP